MSNKTLTIGVLVAIVIAIGGYFFPQAGKVMNLAGSTSCGGSTTCYSDLFLTSAFGGGGSLQTTGVAVIGGLFTDAAGILKTNTNSTSTTATSQTLALSDVQGYDTVVLTPNVGSDTVTFFASSTAATWLPTTGNSQTTCFINGTTTTGIVLTFAGGTGTKLQVASSSATVLGSTELLPQKEGCFTFTRANSTATTFDILAAYTAFQ
jgi:hypothetical protein